MDKVLPSRGSGQASSQVRGSGKVSSQVRLSRQVSAADRGRSSSSPHRGRKSSPDKMESAVKSKESKKKEFQCTQCDYISTRKSNYDKNIFTHSSDKNYKCGLCPKSYKTESSLKTHSETKHAMSAGGARKYQCPGIDCTSSNRKLDG